MRVNVAGIALGIASAVALLTACGRGSAPSSSGEARLAGVSYVVEVFRPTHGTVTSAEGRIRCGSAATATACSATYGWSEIATLTAAPDPGYAFESWSGDCQLTGPCVLGTATSGLDKYVVASFALEGEVGHGNWTSPRVHGPGFFDYLAGVPARPQCPDCHGPNLTGVGIAPSCDGCHAQAGWANWRTSCSFCHGAKDAAAKAGYAFADRPQWAAPPDAVSQRLDGTPAPSRTGAHQAHLSGLSGGQPMAAPFACATCHPVPSNYTHARGAPAIVTLSGAGQAQLPAALGAYDPTSGTCATYCHGAGGSPRWDAVGVTCTSCHGAPPSPESGHPAVEADLTRCVGCHDRTMNADGSIDVASGRHVDGVVDGAGCGGCHPYPPATGAHVAHFGLTGAAVDGYGDVRTLQDRTPGASPVSSPAVYAFGCGLCHPTDPARHRDGTVQVVLREEAGTPPGSLKARASPDAAFDPATGTCSGVYCHSSGQESPAYVVTPGWRSGATLACSGCHANPPRYPSGGAGTATANTHVNLADDGYEFGHFLGLIGPWLESRHGGARGIPGDDAAPITCQTCHYDTTDPASTGPSGFYWLDTTGDYLLPGGDLYRLSSGWPDRIRCTSCHLDGGPATTGVGEVLPLRHVNGARDVVFDPRTTLPAIPWLPAAPLTPVAPYWTTDASPTVPEWPATVIWSGTTVSFSLAASSYDPQTKTCTNVACHLAESPRWGTPYGWSQSACSRCHPSF